MKIKFLGAAGTVTGSSYVVTSESGQSLLVDLGMFQGTEDIEALNYEEYEYDLSQLSGAVLTHAHLDHCGRLPFLLKAGFKGKVYMTRATGKLAQLVLFDSAKIAVYNENEAALYDKRLARKTIRRFSYVEYHQQFKIKDLAITLRDAGHILGSSSVEIVDTQSSSDFKKIVFSGDLGNFPEDLQPHTEFIDNSDVVVMESTYGDKDHAKEDPNLIIQREINLIEKSKSTLMIPCFSIERTQEMLHLIKHLKKENKIAADTPVYHDSPMAYSATEIYLDYPQLFNDHIKNELKNEDPFIFPGMRVIRSRRESEQIWRMRGPQVIIAGSGMMSGGRIVSHAANFLPQEKARLLIVGYQGEGTLGRELVEGNKEVMIDGQMIQVKAAVNSTRSMSSHAGQSQLMEWLGHIQGVKKVFLTHGENEARQALSEKIKSELSISDVVLPSLNQEIEF